MSGEPSRGLLDTNILILRTGIDPAELPDEVAISTVTLGELVAGVNLARGDDPGSRMEAARRVEVLQRAESEFDPLPYDTEAARAYGQLVSATVAAGRTARTRTADLMIAAVAASHGLPLYTTNPSDFAGLDGIVTVIPVRRPTLP